MPTLGAVEALMKTRMERDSSGQMRQAGALWKELQLSFFYQNQDTVQIVAAEVAVAAAAQDSRRLSDEVLHHLQSDILLQTGVKKAIARIHVATFIPEPV